MSHVIRCDYCKKENDTGILKDGIHGWVTLSLNPASPDKHFCNQNHLRNWLNEVMGD